MDNLLTCNADCNKKTEGGNFKFFYKRLRKNALINRKKLHL